MAKHSALEICFEQNFLALVSYFNLLVAYQMLLVCEKWYSYQPLFF